MSKIRIGNLIKLRKTSPERSGSIDSWVYTFNPLPADFPKDQHAQAWYLYSHRTDNEVIVYKMNDKPILYLGWHLLPSVYYKFKVEKLLRFLIGDKNVFCVRHISYNIDEDFYAVS